MEKLCDILPSNLGGIVSFFVKLFFLLPISYNHPHCHYYLCTILFFVFFVTNNNDDDDFLLFSVRV